MKLNRSETSGKKLYTGFFSGKVVCVNPTKEELAELIGYDLKDDAEDIKYEGETDKKEAFVSLSFWLKSDTPEPKYFNARFRLVDKPLTSEKTGKTQFVNQTAGSTWVDEEANLPDWFTHFQEGDKDNKKNVADKICREAIQGEANLYVFLRAWLGKVEWFDFKKMTKDGEEPTNCLIEKDRLFRNVEAYVEDEYRWLAKAQVQLDAETNRDEKAKMQKSMLTTPVLALACVYSTEKEGELKMYQNLYSEFLGGYLLKKFNLAISSGNWMNDDKTKKFYEQITGEHGCKDAYTLTQLQEFDADAHQQSSGETFTPVSEGDSAQDTSY
jgi:hypothetical protein